MIMNRCKTFDKRKLFSFFTISLYLSVGPVTTVFILSKCIKAAIYIKGSISFLLHLAIVIRSRITWHQNDFQSDHFHFVGRYTYLYVRLWILFNNFLSFWCDFAVLLDHYRRCCVAEKWTGNQEQSWSTIRTSTCNTGFMCRQIWTSLCRLQYTFGINNFQYFFSKDA